MKPLLNTVNVYCPIDESSGVAGYHFNGDVATWGELAIREELEAVVREARGEG